VLCQVSRAASWERFDGGEEDSAQPQDVEARMKHFQNEHMPVPFKANPKSEWSTVLR